MLGIADQKQADRILRVWGQAYTLGPLRGPGDSGEGGELRGCPARCSRSPWVQAPVQGSGRAMDSVPAVRMCHWRPPPPPRHGAGPSAEPRRDWALPQLVLGSGSRLRPPFPARWAPCGPGRLGAPRWGQGGPGGPQGDPPDRESQALGLSVRANPARLGCPAVAALLRDLGRPLASLGFRSLIRAVGAVGGQASDGEWLFGAHALQKGARPLRTSARGLAPDAAYGVAVRAGPSQWGWGAAALVSSFCRGLS